MHDRERALPQPTGYGGPAIFRAHRGPARLSSDAVVPPVPIDKSLNAHLDGDRGCKPKFDREVCHLSVCDWNLSRLRDSSLVDGGVRYAGGSPNSCLVCGSPFTTCPGKKLSPATLPGLFLKRNGPKRDQFLRSLPICRLRNTGDDSPQGGLTEIFTLISCWVLAGKVPPGMSALPLPIQPIAATHLAKFSAE
jgi:hypothetical protein